MLQHKAVRSCIHNNAVNRTRMMPTFMCNNGHWLKKTGPARCALEEMLKEAENCKDEKVTNYMTFMRPRC